MAWEIYARGALFSWRERCCCAYLRGMGARIRRRVVGTGFAQVVDPDMLDFEDGVTVSCRFKLTLRTDAEDRPVRIRRRATVGSGALLLYGAEIGANSHVSPHSVVMKRESLLPGRSYAGSRRARSSLKAPHHRHARNGRLKPRAGARRECGEWHKGQPQGWRRGWAVLTQNLLDGAAIDSYTESQFQCQHSHPLREYWSS